MTSLAPKDKDFNEKAAPPAPPALATPAEYQALLETLVAKGTGWGKTKEVGAYLTDDINFVTLTPSSLVKETKNKIEVQKVAVTVDVGDYPREETRNLVFTDTVNNWSNKVIKKRITDEAEFVGPGVWLVKRNAFLDDYAATSPDSNTYAPSPGAFRVTAEVDKPVNIPVQWSGGFVVEPGGVLAIRQKHVADLVEALNSIRSGEKTAEQALYSADPKTGEKLAKFDIYGMGPGFREKNYAPVTLSAEVTAIKAGFAAPANGNSKPAARKLG